MSISTTIENFILRIEKEQTKKIVEGMSKTESSTFLDYQWNPIRNRYEVTEKKINNYLPMPSRGLKKFYENLLFFFIG